ncbi:hypothetical protein LTR95_015928 [Oleoguttula sp. CCFEE 5521]
MKQGGSAQPAPVTSVVPPIFDDALTADGYVVGMPNPFDDPGSDQIHAASTAYAKASRKQSRVVSVYRESAMTGITEMSITDIDIEFYTRPLTVSSYASSIAIAEYDDNDTAVRVHELLDTKKEAFNHTLDGILSGNGVAPYDMFDFYMYSISQTTRRNLLDFW